MLSTRRLAVLVLTPQGAIWLNVVVRFNPVEELLYGRRERVHRKSSFFLIQHNMLNLSFRLEVDPFTAGSNQGSFFWPRLMILIAVLLSTCLEWGYFKRLLRFELLGHT